MGPVPPAEPAVPGAHICSSGSSFITNFKIYDNSDTLIYSSPITIPSSANLVNDFTEYVLLGSKQLNVNTETSPSIESIFLECWYPYQFPVHDFGLGNQ